MKVAIQLTDIQHIKKADFAFEIEGSGLLCIAGKNGTGKTTLVKAIRNITNADTFKRTSSEGIFTTSSSILYEIDGAKIAFQYDQALDSLNCREQIPKDLKNKISVELPIPHGERFNFFQRISNADLDIRKAIVLEQYASPNELKTFLQAIYQTDKFEKLVEISIRGSIYYCSLLNNGRYLREDYFSSGEYFLISLFKRIKQGCKLIVIDEIDISLDAAAQVRLVEQLREFGRTQEVVFVFTTHSLAMMRTLRPDELVYMEQDAGTGISTLSNVSYNYIKSILYGFRGWDKYILTEDDVLHDLIEYVIQRYCGNIFYTYKVIFIGGGSNTTDLLKRNRAEKFLGDEKSVIAVLDGDQRDLRHSKSADICCIPIESVEKALLVHGLAGDFQSIFDIDSVLTDVAGLREYLRGDSQNSQKAPALNNAKPRFGAGLFGSAFLTYWLEVVERIKGFVSKLIGESSLNKKQGSGEKSFNIAAKKLHAHLIKNKLMSNRQIFEYLCTENDLKFSEFSEILKSFLTIQVTR